MVDLLGGLEAHQLPTAFRTLNQTRIANCDHNLSCSFFDASNLIKANNVLPLVICTLPLRPPSVSFRSKL